jgi:branched-chain amino acid transport system substrate-binding protein
MRIGRIARGCTCVLMVAGVAGCGTTSNSTTTATATGGKLIVYASVPSQQPGTDVYDAEQLALTQVGKTIGKFTIVIKHTKLPADTTKNITANARQAVDDPATVAYLGEVVPGTSDASVPITNELGILQVSPTDDAIELTQGSPVLPNTRKALFYPSESTYGYTFARLVPSAAREASAIATELQSLHVSKLDVASDGLPCTTADISGCYGKAIAAAVSQAAPAKSITVQHTATGADAAFVGSNSAALAAKMFSALAAANPKLKLFGPSALDTSSFTTALGAGPQANVYISAPGFLHADLPSAGAAFEAAFKNAYGHAPALQAIFGYAAMQAVLNALNRAGGSANNRNAILNDLFGLSVQQSGIGAGQSVLGPFSINRQTGDVSLSPAPFVFNRFRAGQLVPFKFVPATS